MWVYTFQMAEKVAWYLDVDPRKIQFFKAQLYVFGMDLLGVVAPPSLDQGERGKTKTSLHLRICSSRTYTCEKESIFFVSIRYGGGLPGNPIRCTYEGTIRDLMMYSQKTPKKLFYQLVRWCSCICRLLVKYRTLMMAVSCSYSK